MKYVTVILKDRAILAGWIAALVLIAALIWSFGFHFRSMSLMHSTNKTLVLMDDARRLSAPLIRHATGMDPLGCWYSLAESDSIFFVFTIMREGILVPCGAEISKSGKVVQIIPLGSHAQQVMEKIPQGLIQVYIRRIESAAAGRGK